MAAAAPRSKLHTSVLSRRKVRTVQNGLALSGTLHWMFDRGLIGFSDDHDILVSRHVNDRDSVEG